MNIDPRIFGFGDWDLWIWFAMSFACLSIGEVLIRYAGSRIAQSTSKILLITSNIIFYSATIFVGFEFFLRGEYMELLLLLGLSFLPLLKHLTARAYATYDEFVDKFINRL